MTRTETEKAIEVMKAFVEGKQIQHSDDDQWHDFGEGWCPYWDWKTTKYRVKPEPMEIEVWTKPGEKPVCLPTYVPEKMIERGWTAKKFREVL